jgi:hypothetical protein
MSLAAAIHEERGGLCRERFVDRDPHELILIWDTPLFGQGDPEEGHFGMSLVARSEFFREELSKWEGSVMKRIYVPFDSCQTLMPLLLGEVIPRFAHHPEFASQRLMEIAGTPDKLVGLFVVASYYGFDFPCPMDSRFFFMPWLVDWVVHWAAGARFGPLVGGAARHLGGDSSPGGS